MNITRSLNAAAKKRAKEAAQAVAPEVRSQITAMAMDAVAAVRNGDEPSKATPWWILRGRAYSLGESQVAIEAIREAQLTLCV